MNDLIDALQVALFAAQHSRPKGSPSPLWQCGDSTCSDGRDMLCGECAEVIAWLDAQHSASRTHEKPIPADKWGFQHPETNQFIVDGSKPGGKAFIEAVEAVMPLPEPPCQGCDGSGISVDEDDCSLCDGTGHA